MTVDLIDDQDLIRHLNEIHSEADTTSFGVLDFVSAFGNPWTHLSTASCFGLISSSSKA
jgi:hypothetical protein